MKRSKYSPLAQEWFTIADNDLGYAKLGLAEDNFFAQVAFQAQQAAEKYLKGFLMVHRIKFRKTHDLVELIELCRKIDDEFSTLRSSADILSPYAVDVRYPVHYPIVERKHAQEAIEAAEEIIRFVKEKLQRE